MVQEKYFNFKSKRVFTLKAVKGLDEITELNFTQDDLTIKKKRKRKNRNKNKNKNKDKDKEDNKKQQTSINLPKGPPKWVAIPVLSLISALPPNCKRMYFLSQSISPIPYVFCFFLVFHV